MKTILVPTDFSLNANKALNYAAEFAKLARSKIIILHVTDLTHASINENVILPENFDREIIDSANKELGILVSATSFITGGIVEQQLYNGFVTDAIQQACKENAVDLIIMGTLGNAGIREKLFGSITAKIISHAEVPVLAIPLMYEWEIPQNILLAVKEFKEDAAVLNPVLKIASILQTPIHVSIFTDEDNAHAVDYLQNSRDLESFTNNLQTANESIQIKTAPLYGHQFEEAIVDYIAENNTGLLVMITHKRTFLESIFNKSMTKKMSYHTNIPLLSLPIHS